MAKKLVIGGSGFIGSNVIRKLVERGDEDDAGLGLDALRDFDAGLARHLDVKEGDVRREPGDHLRRLVAVAGLGDDGQFRPERRLK